MEFINDKQAFNFNVLDDLKHSNPVPLADSMLHGAKEQACKRFPNLDHLPGLDLFCAAQSDISNRTNAQLMTDDMFKEYYDASSFAPRFLAFHNDKNTIAANWDMGQVMECLTSSPELYSSALNSGQVKQARAALDHYWDKNGKPPGYNSGYTGGDKYYDDNAWVGIAFMDAHKLKHDPYYLNMANEIYDFDEYGSRGTEQLAKPGGVFWTQQEGDKYRATVSTAGAAQLALMLYDTTHIQKYLDFGKKQFDWVNEYLRTPAGLYQDGLDKDGSPHREEYTYNQGLMLGDATLLFKATSDPKYLEMASNIAKTSLAAFNDNGSQVPGENPLPFKQQLTFFNAVFFKNLMDLDAIAPDPSYRKALADYADYIKQNTDQNGLVTNKDGKQTLLDQASAIQIVELARTHPPADSNAKK